MKKLLFLFLILSFDLCAQGIIVSGPVTVSQGATYGNSRPRVLLTEGNVPVAIWGKNGANSAIYASRWNGTSFGLPIQVSPVGMAVRTVSAERIGAAVYKNTIYVVFTSLPLEKGKLFLAKSTDGGQTFHNAVQIANTGTDIAYFPGVSVDETGNPIVYYIRSASDWSNPRHVVLASNDGGSSFENEKNINSLSPGEACDCCPATLVAKNNRQVFLFRNNDNNLRDIWAAFSEDSGNSFYKATDVDPTNWVVPACPTSGPNAIVSGDSIIYAWMSAATGQGRIMLGTVNLNAAGGSAKTLDPSNDIFTQNQPAIAGKNDTIALVWHDNRNGSNDCRISWSSTGATGLFQSSHELVMGAGSQQNADISYSDGLFHIIYQDDKTYSIIYLTANISRYGSISEEGTPGFSIYPNPFSHTAQVTIEETNGLPVYFELFEHSGKKLLSFPVYNSEFQIPGEGLKPGVYVMEITSQGYSSHKKVIITH
ncbi:MAG: T9SS type A sorting domain-containing protein [Bacteroidota bacterium]|nr:T9SS type A sorting domain-containing protein [Bacteroidota bacterium]